MRELTYSSSGLSHRETSSTPAAVALLLPWPIHAITLAVAKSDQQSFHEYWNGFETNAYQRDVTCLRDGVCVHTYDCDPYIVVEIEYYTDSEGKSQSRPVQRTKYHSCPYSQQETSYYVDTTLRSFAIATNLMTGDPYRMGKPIPGGKVTEAPAPWLQAKERIDSGDPGPVTMVNRYENYLLGSKESLFKRYSELIEPLRERGLLPRLASGVEAHYFADKLYVVGSVDGIDEGALKRSVAKLNGAVGMELRGDLHVVLLNADDVEVDKEDYGNALLGYWQSPEVFGRDALGKNAIVLVLAVEPPRAPSGEQSGGLSSDSPVITWAYGATGMPLGNEALLQQISSELPGKVIDERFFGNPRYDVSTETVVRSESVIENMLWGRNRFERVSMSGSDADDVGGGFSYLSDEWRPDPGTITLVYVLSAIFSLGALTAGYFISSKLRSNRSPDLLRHLFTSR